MRPLACRGWAAACAVLLAAAQAGAQVPALEREMLMSFYQATNGARWTQSTGWNGPVGTECTWHGVTCFQGRVTALRLSDNNLGEADAAHPFAFLLPVQPVNLPQLQELELAGNRFEQIVPAAYGNFPKLVRLDLGRLALTGSLPTQLANVETLQTLYLDRNRFTGTLPAAWAQLLQLRNLDLSDNALGGPLPAEWSALTQMQSLLLGDDPSTNDRDMVLDGPIPAAWGAMTRLRTLSLGANRIEGELPAAMAQWTQLRSLFLDANRIEGTLPEWTAAWTQIETLTVSNNRLTGPLPQALSGWERLGLFSAFGNQLDGPLPADWSRLGALRILSLQNNRLDGAFPPGLCSARSLQQLILTSNRFSGEVPPCIGQLTELRRLGLGANAFRGDLPASLMQLTKLEALPDNVIDDAHLFFNAFRRPDAALLAFIRARFPRGTMVDEFLDTQALAPENVTATVLDADSVRLQWTPRGQVSNGRFHVLGGPSDTLFCDGFDAPCVEPAVLAGPIHVETVSRSVTQATVDGLSPGVRHRFVVLSVSEPADNAYLFFDQANRVSSDPSHAVGVTLP